MDILVINLETAAQRRGSVQKNFVDSGFPAHWTLKFMRAISAAQVGQNGVATSLGSGETGCFLSHLQSLQAASAHDEHVLIAEDDVLFCSRTAAVVEAAIARLAPDTWDLLFTDLAVPRAEDMLQLFRLRRQLKPTGGFELLDLKGAIFCGSTAYVVNRRSKKKVLDALRPTQPFTIQFDLVLRAQIHAGTLKGSAIFPFATSLSPAAARSQIQGEDIAADYLWNAFRRLMWIDAGQDNVEAILEDVGGRVIDPETRVFCKILEGLLCEGYEGK